MARSFKVRSDNGDMTSVTTYNVSTNEIDDVIATFRSRGYALTYRDEIAVNLFLYAPTGSRSVWLFN